MRNRVQISAYPIQLEVIGSYPIIKRKLSYVGFDL